MIAAHRHPVYLSALRRQFAVCIIVGSGRRYFYALFVFNKEHAFVQRILHAAVILLPNLYALFKAVQLLGGLFNVNPCIPIAVLIEHKPVAIRQRTLGKIVQIQPFHQQIDIADTAVVIIQLQHVRFPHSSMTSRSSGTNRFPL